jgi:hypothetical protein
LQTRDLDARKLSFAGFWGDFGFAALHKLSCSVTLKLPAL